MWKQSIEAKKFSQDKFSKIKEQVLIESEVTVFIQDQSVYHSLSTPERLDFLTKGYLAANYGPNCLGPLTIEKKGNAFYVDQEPSQDTATTLPPVPLKPKQIMQLMAMFQDKVELYKETGIAQSAAICKVNEILHFGDDINEYNAVYKAFGMAAETQTFGDGILVLSGKVCSKIVSACICCGISTIISRTGMTDKAVSLALAHSTQCIGFCRGKHFTVYTV